MILEKTGLDFFRGKNWTDFFWRKIQSSFFPEKNPIQFFPKSKSMQECPVCNGTKETNFWFESVCHKITCHTCNGTGKVTDEQMQMREFEMQMWCECETLEHGAFHDDGEMPWDWCVGKHHYHCTRCGKLTQIG